MDLVYWDHSYNALLLLNLALVAGLFTSLRLFSGTIAHINASDELLKKDNPAFGISLAGVTFAITIMLSGTMFGNPETSMLESVIAVGAYGVVGIVLMAITRVVFDKLALPDISLRDEIVKGNIAVAIADTGNVLAAAIIVRAVMVWITNNTIEGLGALLAGYAISQAVLTVSTYLYMKVFSVLNKERSIQDELAKGNIALGLRFAGKKIGTALAIAIAAQLVVYELYDMVPVLMAWFVVSVVAIIVLKVLTVIAESIILFGVNINDEVLDQRNIAVGALQAVIYISLGILLAEL